MNEDQNLSENQTSEAQNIAQTPNTSETDKQPAESVGEAVIDAAKKEAKTARSSKFFQKKKNIDEEQNAKIAELTNDLQRTRADFENFRRQSDLQKQQYGNVVKFTTLSKVLPLIDDMERAIAANPDTLKPLEKNLEKTIKNLGLEKIPSTQGEAFNPDLHDAVMVEGDGDNELIAETLRTGYYYEGQVLRPTMVKVSKQ